MDHEQLLHRLNNTPIKINAPLMRIKLNETNEAIARAKKYLHYKLSSVGIEQGEDISDKIVVTYCNRYLVKKLSPNKPYHMGNNEKFSLETLKEHFPNETIVNTYLELRECLSLKKRYEAILKHEKNGYIQPTFAINASGSIYTAKPALQLPYPELAQYFDCNHYYFNSLQEAVKAVTNAKEDSEIIAIVRTTVFYRNARSKQEKEKRRQEIITMIEAEPEFMPLEPYYEEFTLDDLGYGDITPANNDDLQDTGIIERKENPSENLESKFSSLHNEQSKQNGNDETKEFQVWQQKQVNTANERAKQFNQAINNMRENYNARVKSK